MPLTPYADVNGNLDLNAVLEQVNSHIFLTWNRIDLFQQQLIMLGGGTILSAQFQPASMPPSWIVYGQAGSIWINIDGTMNLNQWYGNVVGVFSTPYGDFNCRVHSFFLDQWNTIKPAILAVLPTGWQSMPMNISGYSMGAAIAFLGACDFRQSNPNQAVAFLGFATPKSLTSGYNGPLPNPCFTVVNSGDCVPYLPPNGALSVAPLVVGVGAFAIPINWRHYGNFVGLQNSGVASSLPASTFNLTPTSSLIGNTLGAHPLAGYLPNVQAVWSANVGVGQDLPLLNFASEVAGTPPVQNQSPSIDADTTVNIPLQNEITFVDPTNSPLNATNLPLVETVSGNILGVTQANQIFTLSNGGNGMSCKLTFFYHDNLAGFSESWYIQGATDPNGVPLALVGNFLNARMLLSGQQTTFDYCRVSTVGTARQVLVYPFDVMNALYNCTGSYTVSRAFQTSDFGGTALVVRKNAGFYYSRFFLRGIPDVVVDQGGLYQAPAAYETNLAAFATFLNTNNISWKASSGPLNPPSVINTAVQNADGTITFGLTGFLFNGVAANTHVNVRINGQVAPPYLNGPLVVVVVNSQTCTTLRKIPLVGFVSGTGKMSASNVNVYRVITSLKVEKVVKRGPGRPFGLYRGRAKNRLLQ
jgi:hypothetical protein